jgi:hypothetical protein
MPVFRVGVLAIFEIRILRDLAGESLDIEAISWYDPEDNSGTL